MILKTLVQLAFIVINYLIAVYQAHRFDVEQKRISHTFWLLIYCALVAASWPIHKNWYLIATVCSLHLPLFNTFLNYYRTPRRPIFYTHPEDPQGSVIDKIWSDVYPAVFCASIITYTILNFYLYGNP